MEPHVQAWITVELTPARKREIKSSLAKRAAPNLQKITKQLKPGELFVQVQSLSARTRLDPADYVGGFMTLHLGDGGDIGKQIQSWVAKSSVKTPEGPNEALVVVKAEHCGVCSEGRDCGARRRLPQ